MTTSQRQKPHRRAVAGSSWLALVAATSIGIGAGDLVRTQVRLDPAVDVALARRPYRLIVQSYAEEGGPDGVLPRAGQRPTASVQRAITAEELERGVQINLVAFGRAGDDADASGAARMVAWIEPGEPDLEFDARTARPGRGSVWGETRSDGDSRSEIRLARRLG